MDRRVKYTQKVIKEAFIDLLEAKDIKKITVSEICEKCDINRATFYRYYLDVYDLLDKIEEDFVNEVKAASLSNTEYTVGSFARDLLNAFFKNKDLAKVLFYTNNNSTNFLNDIMSLAYEKCKEKWQKDIPSLPDEDVEYATSYIFNGALGIINYWIANDFNKSVDEIANIIATLAYFGTNRFIYKRK